MDGDASAWLPLDPDTPDDSPLFGGVPDAQARVVAVVTHPSAWEGSWAARAAVGLAQGCARHFGRVLLADLDVARPRLHEVLGTANGEGVSDIFVWGASLQRVSQPVKEGFLFAPAGTVVADPGQVLSNPRWDSLIEGFQRAGATLILFLPSDLPGLEQAMTRATDALVLSAREAVPNDVVAMAGTKLRALHGPGEVEVGGDGGGVPSGEDETQEGALPDYEEEPWEKDVAASVSAAEALRSRTGIIAMAVLLLVVVIIILAWTGLVPIPGLTPLLRGADIGPTPRVFAALPVLASSVRPLPG